MSNQSLLISVRLNVSFSISHNDILGINCQILRDWIHLHIPKHEDGNNFGVEVQEEALQELAAVKEESQSAMEEHAAYHLARANIMEKILQEGNIKDLKSKRHNN